MTRDWLRAEVERLVVFYRSGDWNGVHAVINRMLALDADGAVVLTRAEAETCADALVAAGFKGPSALALRGRLEEAS